MCVHVCVCVLPCMSVRGRCVCVFACAFTKVWMNVYLYIWMNVYLYIHVCAC